MKRYLLLLPFAVLGCNDRTAAVAPPEARQTPPPAAASGTVAAPRPETNERTPEEVVLELGRRMKQVPTSAAPEIAAKAIREQYDGLVHPDLLNAWAKAPSDAPGRPVSSPWPERIAIEKSSVSEGRAVIDGLLVEATSTGVARQVPIRVTLENAGGSWQVVGYRANAVAAGDDTPEGAVQVVQDYYRAIDARDYERAYRYWGDSGPPGQTFRTFVAGFANTESVTVRTGMPSRLEGAAGSRYVDVPVTILARTKSGQSERFEGTYTVRRSVVDGATPAQRRWHLDRAAIHRAGASALTRSPAPAAPPSARRATAAGAG